MATLSCPAHRLVHRASLLALWLTSCQAAPTSPLAEDASDSTAGGPDAPTAASAAETMSAANTAPVTKTAARADSAAGAGRPAQATPASTSPAATTATSAGSGALTAPVTRDAGPAMQGMGAPDRLVTFHNGGFWLDAAGERIEAHGGGFIKVHDTWYWFGEDKSANSAGFKGVNCYASKDLVTWRSRGAVVTRGTAPELDTMDRIVERPKVIYNAHTQRYVMWLHWEGRNYAEAKAGVFSSDTVDGPYSFHSAFQPEGNMSRDDTLFLDDDGSAYFISAANENADLMVYRLSADFLSIEQHVVTLFAGQKREAPAVFKDADRYYLITSGATGWDPNQAKYATASAMEGPWSALQNLGDASTFDTQPTYVLPIQGSQRTSYVYAGDRWQDPDLASSKYIWLPLQLDGAGGLSLDNYADWSLDLETGEWSSQDGFIAQQAWRLMYVDSEETRTEDGRGTNAFDGAAATIWHTAYTDTKPGPPHELQIDLGASYAIDGLRYLPRQDGVDNGTVADYELYVSRDPNQWGTAVSAGTFEANGEPKLVKFAPRSGQYVRFVALREIHDKPYTSIAELDLSGSPE